jgi:hypothetical protein
MPMLNLDLHDDAISLFNTRIDMFKLVSYKKDSLEYLAKRLDPKDSVGLNVYVALASAGVIEGCSASFVC